VQSSKRHRAAVIGGGPAGLMAAEVLAQSGAEVVVHDAMPSVGRKFLLAGRGGLNLTHSETLASFLSRYGEAEPNLREAIAAFPPDALRAWADALGQETFVGSSGRVFPKAMKASPLLRAWLAKLRALGASFKMRHRWIGWDDDGKLLFESSEGRVAESPDVTVLALGGASWPRLGSDGVWTAYLREKSVDLAPLKPSNCGFVANWSDVFAERFAGQPLKSIGLSFGGQAVRGEAIITRRGLEGGGIYALSAPLRETIATGDEAILRVDLRPDTSHAMLERKLGAQRAKQSLSTWLRKATGLSPPAIGLLHEAAAAGGVRISETSAADLALLIKAVPVRLIAPAPIERAISSAGGIRFSELDRHFMLHTMPGVFAAGEMLDWEAPTGGYLLQACFATGAAAGRGALAWLRERQA
jgi:uncharacterized flavoprotein (TIGR03862 family)